MKIGIDLSYQFKGDRLAGIGLYVMNLLEGFKKMNRLDDIILIIREEYRGEIKERFPEVKTIVIKDDMTLKILSLLKKKVIQTFYIQKFLLPRKVNMEKLDVMFYTWHHYALRPEKIKTKTVVMFHDILHKHYPNENWLVKLYYNWRMAQVINKTDYIIVSTEFVRNDIYRHYPSVNRQKLIKIDIPVVIQEDQMTIFEGVKKPYFVTINSLDKHKNLITLIQAFAKISKRIPHDLVIVGKGNTEAIKQMTCQYGVAERVVITGYVSEGEKNYLYHYAEAFISASLHEGFGSTPVEAMVMGVPVITSKETALPESTMGLAYYYEPGRDAAALAEKMLELLENKPSDEKLREIREKVLKRYDLMKVSKRYLKLFDKIRCEENSQISGKRERRM